MLRMEWAFAAALAVVSLTLADEPAPAKPAQAEPPASGPSSAETGAAASTSEPTSSSATDPKPATTKQSSSQPEPPRDPTLISVPSNTLGPGIPLWVLREQDQAAARIAEAEADEAEARAALARIEAQRAADDPYFFSDGYGGVVVYGPRRPGLDRAVRNRPIPPRRIATPLASTGTPVDDDPFDAAQRTFYETTRPPIGPIVERQLEAQRRFGENAYPSKIIDIQRGMDNAVIRARRGAPKPQDATK
jgi:hypothetical protein